VLGDRRGEGGLRMVRRRELFDLHGGALAPPRCNDETSECGATFHGASRVARGDDRSRAVAAPG
jgi:hypothetical protein